MIFIISHSKWFSGTTKLNLWSSSKQVWCYGASMLLTLNNWLRVAEFQMWQIYIAEECMEDDPIASSRLFFTWVLEKPASHITLLTLGPSRINMISCSISTFTAKRGTCCCSGHPLSWCACARFSAATRNLSKKILHNFKPKKSTLYQLRRAINYFQAD